MGNDVIRCPWPQGSPLLQEYHDREWGTPVHDDRKHFEFLTLETMQAGLSWMIVLKKREAFRAELLDFDYRQIAQFGEDRISRMLANPEIIRNRSKILAIIHNAKVFMEIQKEFGTFDRYIWGFTGGKTIVNTSNLLPVTTELSDLLAADFKKRGFKFLGSTTVYAHLQAIGIVNDHRTDCFRYRELIK
jgi:DNA-3-methyladenine glycosylase I